MPLVQASSAKEEAPRDAGFFITAGDSVAQETAVARKNRLMGAAKSWPFNLAVEDERVATTMKEKEGRDRTLRQASPPLPRSATLSALPRDGSDFLELLDEWYGKWEDAMLQSRLRRVVDLLPKYDQLIEHVMQYKERKREVR
jgi:hypothetical protein